MTVDWLQWMTASREQQERMLRRYREIVKAESDDAKANNYTRMTAAMAEAGRVR